MSSQSSRSRQRDFRRILPFSPPGSVVKGVKGMAITEKQILKQEKKQNKEKKPRQEKQKQEEKTSVEEWD